MNLQSTYAFYGSLRRGMVNHKRYGAGLRFLFQEEIQGYQLFEMKHYPYAVKTGSKADFITVEVFKVTDQSTERAIHELELGVGYYYDEVIIQGKEIGIYLFRERGPEPLVKGGDWVRFFGS